MIQVLGKVGEQDLARGHLSPPSMNRLGQLIVQNSFAAAVERGRVFAACAQANVTTENGLGTSPTAVCLSNPAGSGVTGRIWYAVAGHLVAPGAAATVWLTGGSNTVAATVTGTLATAHRCLKLGGITPASQGNRCVVTTASTVPAAPVVVDILGTQLTGAITTMPFTPALRRCYHGGLLLQPGTFLTFGTSTTGGASGFASCFIWEECDLIN